MDVSPVQMGKELFHVLDANQLCMGRVGLGDKVCLKLPNSCEKTSHAKNKHTISDTSFIGLKASTQDVGHMSMILPTEELDGKMIEKLLNVEGEIDWISEFAKIKANSSKNLDDLSKADKFIVLFDVVPRLGQKR